MGGSSPWTRPSASGCGDTLKTFASYGSIWGGGRPRRRLRGRYRLVTGRSYSSLDEATRRPNVQPASGVRCEALSGPSPGRGPPTPQKLESFFRLFAALNLAVIGSLVIHVNVHIDCHLISCCASLYVSSGERTLSADIRQSAPIMRRNCDDAAARDSARNAWRHARAYRRQETCTPTPQHTPKTKHAPAAARRRAATVLRAAPVPSMPSRQAAEATGSVLAAQPSLRRVGLRGPRDARPNRPAGGSST